jgi:bifunctional DNA-binding transcriptional regulator/antitoxin component of YhaV-PrlF toxin-antitoxin module
MEESVVKKVDEQGRLSIPAAWRKDWKSDMVVLKKRGETIEMIPLESISLTSLFDSIVVPDDVDFADPHSLKKALMERKEP